jgi:hypothetical protein
MRMVHTGTGREDVLGTATISFYASSERTIDACSVHWDSDPGYAALLPALAFDEWLPNLRSVSVQTDAGPGELRTKDARLWSLGEAEEWIADANAQLAAGEVPRFEALPLVAEYDGDGGQPVAAH